MAKNNDRVSDDARLKSAPEKTYKWRRCKKPGIKYYRIIISVVVLWAILFIILYSAGLLVEDISSLAYRKSYYSMLNSMFTFIGGGVGINAIFAIICSLLDGKYSKIKKITPVALFTLVIAFSVFGAVAASGHVGLIQTENKIKATLQDYEPDSIMLEESNEPESMPPDLASAWFILWYKDVDTSTICEWIVNGLAGTGYKESVELDSLYAKYVNEAAGKESKIPSMGGFEGRTDLSPEEKKLHEDCAQQRLEVIYLRKQAHEHSLTYKNTKSIAEHFLSLGDIEMRLKNYKKAYAHFLDAIYYYDIALKLALSSEHRKENVLYVLERLAKVYGKHRLQHGFFRSFLIEDSATPEDARDTEAIYRHLTQEEFLSKLVLLQEPLNDYAA